MYADPQSVTVSGTAIPLPRIGAPNPERRGTFRSADGLTTLETRQDATNNRFRREVRLTLKKVAVDPISALNKEVSTSVIIAVDEPRIGFSDAELAALLTGLTTWFTAANRDKLLGGEL